MSFRPGRGVPKALGHLGVLVLLMAFTLGPFAWVVVSSFKPSTEIFTRTPRWTIDAPTLRNYEWAMGPTGARLGVYLYNTVATATAVAALVGVIAAMGGYALSRYVFPGREWIAVALLLSQMFQGPPVMIAWYRMVSLLGLLNTKASLVLAYLGLTLPIGVWLMRGFFSSVPRELEEAALVDGCTPFGAFRRIMVPLALPGLLATSLYAFIVAWNDYQYALILVSSDRAKTVQLGLSELLTFFGQTNWGGVMASAVIVTLPIVVIFVLIQRLLVEGITAGAVKA